VKKKIYIIIFSVSLASYLSIFIPPDVFWFAGFMTYLIPLVVLFNFFLFIRYLKNQRLLFLVPLGIVIAGWGFINDTFQYPFKRAAGKIRVLSYNTRVFNIYDEGMVKNSYPKKMADWIRGNNPDVICLQEFYTETGGSDLNTIRLISPDKKYNFYNLPVFTNKIGAQFGIAIFSKYPVIQTGEIGFGGKTQNQAIFADIVIDSDTLRIYNVHLQSMHIDDNHMIGYPGDLQDGVKDLYGRLKFGFIQRSQQVRRVRDHISHCRYKIILCGDLNDLPYSYSYHQLKSVLKNSFSSVGRGFGFTYNGNLPFLRIDNQFYSPGIKANTFITYRKIRFSDHFPIMGTYTIAGR
jgi:endonuclease/exonuclease/phosphatase family metal-dependent hydrolase